MRKAIPSILLSLAILALGAVGAATMILSRQPPQKVLSEAPAPPVRVMIARPSTHEFIVETQGSVRPRTETVLISELSGRVIHVSDSFVVGGDFEKDDLLLQIDPRDYEVQVLRAEAQTAQARRALEIAQSEARLARQEWEDFGEGAAPALVARRPQLDEARSLLDAAEADLAQARLNLERTRIVAPYSGRVRSKQVDLGQFVTRGAPLAEIYAIDYVEVRLPLADEDLAYLDLPLPYRKTPTQDPGAHRAERTTTQPKVRLRARFAGAIHEWPATIVRTEGEVDPDTRMIHAIARVNDPYRYTAPTPTSRRARPPLEVGIFVDALVQGRTAENVFVIPRAAVRGENEILIVAEGDRIDRRRVEILRAETENVVISSGLAEGERVVLTQLEAVSNGMKVRPLPPTNHKTDAPES